MAPTIANCKKCKKLFQKVTSNLCGVCLNLEEEQFKLLYRTLQKSAPKGGIPIEELSSEVGVSVEEIERFYLEGRLSTAGTLLKMQCQQCGVMIGELQRRGRYCIACSEKTASQAGVEVKSKQTLEKGEEEARQKQEQLALLKKNQTSSGGRSERRFGMVRRS